VNIAVSPYPTVTYVSHDPIYQLDMTIRVTRHSVRVECLFDRLPSNYLVEMIVRAGDAAKSVVDLVAFSQGYGVIITFDEYRDVDGIVKKIACVDNILCKYCTAFSSTTNFHEALVLVTQDPPLFMALNDLIIANTLPHYVPANCGRTVEGIRHIIAGPGTDAKIAWPIMRKALNLDKTFIEIITSNAMPYRHGHRITISSEITHTIIQRSWQIMDRYLHLRLRKQEKLPEDEFPILFG
jgi:hypothetical protein